MKKTLNRIGALLLLISALFINVLNVNAASLSISSSSNKSHSLGFIGASTPNDYSEGKATLEITGVKNNVVTVKLTISNVGADGGVASAITSPNTTILLPDELVNNFDIAIGSDNSSHGAPSYTEGGSIINWTIAGDLPVGETAYMTYTITPKNSYSTDILNQNIYVASTATIQFTNEAGGIVDVEFNNAVQGCVPAITLTDSNTPTTGVFSNIILLVGIIGVAGGILVISLKNNKFQNI